MSDAANLKIQQQINDAIAERGRLLAAQTKQISDQAELAIAFCKAMKCEDIDRVSERVQEIRAGLADAAKAAEDQANAISAATEVAEALRKKREEERDLIIAQNEALEKQKKEIDNIEKSLNKGLKFMTDTFSGALGSLSAIGSAISSVAIGAFNIGKALLAIPLKIFDIMLDKAAELANASRAIAEAIEEVREQYGDVNKGLSKQVVDGGKDMGDSLGEAGLSISRVFGMGPEGVAAAIRESLDIAKSLGPVVGLLGEKFGDAAGDLVVFKKGLGLTNEDMKAVIMQSKAMGKNFRTEFLKMSKIANDMGDKFSSLGISSKDIARDMAYLTTNSGKFGRVTKEAMAAASVTVRSYGLELKDVVGVLDQFADFESAATNASKFAQSFGTILDPIKLMKEENPAKAFEYLREQMLAAGQSAETMNKAQIKQLATLSGMDENNVRLAFSNKNVGKSYEQIQKEAEKSGKKQKTQQEIFDDLGKSIKRVVEAIQYSGSLLQEFFTGFGEGISRSKDGKKVLYDLASLLKEVRHLGREVGRAFMESFPGVGDFFDGLHGFLQILKDPKKGVPALGQAFRDFFNMLKTDPEKAIDNLKKSLLSLTGGESGAFGKMIEGARTAAKALVGIFAGMINMIVPKLIEGIQSFTKILADPEGIKAGFSKLAGDAESMFSPLFEAIIKNAGPLWESIKEMFSVGWEKYGDDVTSFLGKVVFASLLFGALKAAIIALPGAIGTFFSGVIVKKLGGKAGESVMRALAKKIFSKGGTAIFAGAAGKALGLAFGATGIGVAITAAISASDVDKIAGKALQEKLDKGEISYSGSAAGGKIAATLVNGLTLGLLSDDTYIAIASSFAGLTDKMMKVIESVFGRGLSETFSNTLTGIFKLFAGFGDIIMGIFTLDLERVINGLGKIIGSLFKLLINSTFSFLMGIPNTFFSLISKIITIVGRGIKKLTEPTVDDVNESVFDALGRMKIAFLDWGKNLLQSIGRTLLAGLIDINNSLKEFGMGWDISGLEKKLGITEAVTKAVVPDVKAVEASLESSSKAITGAALDSLNEVGDEVGQYSGLNEKQIKKTQENLNAGIKNMQEIVSGIDNAALISMRESINSLDTGALSMFEQLAVKINESINPESMSQAFANMNVFDEMLLGKLESVLTRANSVGNLAKEFGDKYSGDLVTYVEKAANELTELDRLLSDIRIGSLDATIDNLNNKLLINNKKINIESKPININMNLNVNFDALKFTTSVFTVASNATKQTGDSKVERAINGLVTARDNFRAGR